MKKKIRGYGFFSFPCPLSFCRVYKLYKFIRGKDPVSTEPSGMIDVGVPEMPRLAASFMFLSSTSVSQDGFWDGFFSKLSSRSFSDFSHIMLFDFQYASG